MDIPQFYIAAEQKEMRLAVSRNLLRHRLLNRYSQKQIALILGVSQPAYSKMEAGRTRVDFIVLRRLADLFEIEPMDFYISGATLEDKIRFLKSKEK